MWNLINHFVLRVACVSFTNHIPSFVGEDGHQARPVLGQWGSWEVSEWPLKSNRQRFSYHVQKQPSKSLQFLYNQVKYSTRWLPGFGLTDGEEMERIWAYLRRFSYITKEMTPSHRIDLLTDGLLHYSRKKTTDLGTITTISIQRWVSNAVNIIDIIVIYSVKS